MGILSKLTLGGFMKKFLTIIIGVMLAVLAAFSLTACDGDQTVSGKKGLLYKKTNSGEYVIYRYVDEGKGVTELDIASYLTDIQGELDGGAELIIKKGAFANNNTLTKVVVPDSVTEINAGAFEKMSKLEELVVPFVGKTANSDLFYGESKKAEDKSVDSARTIAHFFGAQSYDAGMSVTINYGASSTTVFMPVTFSKITVTASYDYSIPMYAFCGAFNLAEVVLGENVDGIGEFAFSETFIESIELPSKVSTIYKSAFKNCGLLQSVEFNSSIAIKEEAFMGCKKMSYFDSDVANTVNFSNVTELGVKSLQFGKKDVKFGFSSAGSHDIDAAFGSQEYKNS